MRRIVRTAEVRPDDVVVEVGPGLGSLTLALLEAADRVVAVEIDDVLAGALPATVAARLPGRADRFALVHSDAHAGHGAARARRRPRWSRTCRTTSPCRCCCTCSTRFPTIERTLVMVQAEVADRLAAPPGSKVYGVPSVKANWYADVKRAGSIGRNVFWPAPNVDSRPRLARPPRPSRSRPPPPGARSSRSSTRPSPSAARRCGPRSPAGPGSAAAAEAALVAAGVSPQARGEALTVEEFAAIAEHGR